MNVCPRCGCKSYEKLKTYAHCVNCNYFCDSYNHPKEEQQLREAIKLLKHVSKKSKSIEAPAKHISYFPTVPVCPPINAMMF